MKTFIFIALLISGAAHAEIYKWKDAAGMMHYSDQPPKGNKAEVLKTKDLPVSTMSAQRREASAASGVAVKASAPAASVPVAAKSEKDEKACKEAMARLSYLQGSKKFSSVNEKGKLEFMEAAQRKAETASVEANIKRVCP
ncbi:DUF4124 domain-containing protein [Janthinobacterium sp. B9-8]|uniref:DUF4124 domain-containing protein n=1 Tax=Janthinobacterium sp. B9-8 TaxID=1236179 RepID=UPI00061D00B0|nr:DUF4124 domain-containing protein [Janthinobacterium sp. B9-8]AMC34505.1 hypothetical protein VN23_07755 [Janthinobacterium sp. B9-8]